MAFSLIHEKPGKTFNRKQSAALKSAEVELYDLLLLDLRKFWNMREIPQDWRELQKVPTFEQG